MSDNISIKKNYIYNLILTAVNLLFPLVTYTYASRILRPEGIGQISFASSIVNYAVMFAQLGIPTYGIRACVRVKDDKHKLIKTVKELLMANAIMAVIAMIALFLSCYGIEKLYINRRLIFIYSITIIGSLLEMTWFFSAMEQYRYIAVRTVIIKVLAAICIFLLVRDSSDTAMYGAVMAGSALVTGFVNFFHSRRFVDLRERCRIELRKHMKPICVFFLMSVATTVYLNLDTVMLGFMTSDAEVGMYNSAVRIKTLLTGVVTALGAVMLPRMSKLAAEDDKEKFLRYASTAMEYTLLIAVPMTVYFMIYSRECILILSGELFLPAVPAMVVIMPTLILIGMTNILGIQILVPMGGEKLVLYSEIAGAVTDVVLNAIFIPMYGAAGAALGTLCAEAMVLIFQLYYLRDRISRIFADISYKKLIFANIAPVCAIILLKNMSFSHILVKLMVSCAAYALVYLGMLILMKEDLVMQVLEILRKKAGKDRID